MDAEHIHGKTFPPHLIGLTVFVNILVYLSPPAKSKDIFENCLISLSLQLAGRIDDTAGIIFVTKSVSGE